MAVSYSQSLGQGNAGSTNRASFAITGFGANIPAGHDVVIWVQLSSGSTSVAASDNSTQTGTANTYTTRIDSATTQGTVRLVCIQAHLTRQIQTTDTITVTHFNGLDAWAASDYAGSSGYDAAASLKAGSSTSVTTNNVTTGVSQGMLIAGAAIYWTSGSGGISTAGTIGGGTATTSGSTTLENTQTDTTGLGGTSNLREIADAYIPFTATGTANWSVTAGASNGWASGIISLAAAAGPTNFPRSFSSTVAVHSTLTAARATPRSFLSQVSVSSNFLGSHHWTANFSSTVRAHTQFFGAHAIRFFTSTVFARSTFTSRIVYGTAYPRIKLGVTQAIKTSVAFIRSVIGGGPTSHMGS